MPSKVLQVAEEKMMEREGGKNVDLYPFYESLNAQKKLIQISAFISNFLYTNLYFAYSVQCFKHTHKLWHLQMHRHTQKIYFHTYIHTYKNIHQHIKTYTCTHISNIHTHKHNTHIHTFEYSRTRYTNIHIYTDLAY